jgi:exonuclease VII small subunit
MIKENISAQNLTKNLKQLTDITTWFNNQEEVDIEEGLKKVKEAAALIKTSRKRLKSIENEFEEIKKEIDIDNKE